VTPGPVRSRAPRRRRWLLLAGGLALVLLPLLRLPRWSATFVAEQLTGFFKRTCTVGAVRYRLFPLLIEVVDLRVAGPTPEAPPFLTLPRAEVMPSLASLFGPRLVLSRVRLEGLTIRVNAYPERGDDIPKLVAPAGDGPSLRIRRLSIAGGQFELNHARVPLNLELPGFEGRLAGRRQGALAGSLSFGPGPLRFGDAPPLPVRTEIDLLVEGGLFTVEEARLRGEKIDLRYTGELRLGSPPVGRFELKGAVDLGELERHVMRTGFGIEGRGHWLGTLDVHGSRLKLAGRMTGNEGVFDGVPVPRFDGRIGYDGEGVHIRGLEVEALQGAGRLDLEIPPGKGSARLDATMQGVDAEGLVAALFDLGAARIGSAASGEISIRWPRGRIRGLSGRIAVDLAERDDGRTPLKGRFVWSAEDGVQQVEDAELLTPTTQLRLSGRIERDDRTHLEMAASSRDLEVADDLSTRVRRALGVADALPAGLTGSGAFNGLWRGSLHAPVFEGRFSGTGVGYRGVRWGRAEWSGVLDALSLESHSQVVRRGDSELWLDGRVETGHYGEQDALDVRLRIDEWPAADLLRALAWDVDLSGDVSSDAELRGRRSAPEGWLRVRSRTGRYYGVPFEDLDLTSVLRGAVVEAREGRARVGGGTLAFHGSRSADGVYDGSAELQDAEIGGVLPDRPGRAPWAGRVSGTATLLGTLARPRILARMTSQRLFLGDEGLGTLAASLRGDGSGTLRVEGGLRSPRVDLRASGSVDVQEPHRAALRLAARETSIDPYLRVFYPALSSALGLVATGEVELRGPLASPRDVELDASVSDLRLLLPEFPVRNRDPIRLQVRGGQTELRDVHLYGEGTDLVVTGSAPVLGDGPLRLSVRGAADLRTLSLVTRRLRGRGAAQLALNVSGSRTAPRVAGALAFEGAGVRVSGFPHGLEGVRGSLRFTESAATLEDVSGSLGGGVVELSGGAAYAAGALTGLDVQVAGRGVALRYPEGLRSMLDVGLRLFGDAGRQWVTGNVDVLQASYTRRYDVASELLAARAPAAPGAALDGGVRYDVKIRAPGTLRIDNNLATLQARADLTLQGSAAAPVVLGRVEIERGRVYFQGNTYLIRRGTLDFANPQKTDPLFDIEAETRIRSYRVTLRMNGTLERVYPTLSSDPPLSAVQILNLMAGADETAVASLTQAQSDQARLAATGAATLAAGRIAEEVGLEREAERLFGLNRFSIDPSLVKGGGFTNPSARLTAGKRVTPDLNVLYSVDLRGSEERVLSVEYTLSDRLSVLMTRSDPGGFGFDLRLRQTR
jgi:translocation and assembly module TamB